MKILLMWPDNKPETRVIIEALEKNGHQIVYWVGEHVIAHLCPKTAVFHDHYDAWDAKRAEALQSEVILPASTRLIASMSDVESAILTMMNKRYNSAFTDERKHVYFTMLAYWDYVLDTFKPDFIVYAVLPHSIYSNVVYELARKKGIPTICFEDTWIARCTLSYMDFWKGSEELRIAIRDSETKNVSVSDLKEDLRKYWEEQTKPRSRVDPVYMTVQRGTSEGWGLFVHRSRIAYKMLRSGSLPRHLVGYVRRFGKENLETEYSRVVQNPDWSMPYVYFPLSHQPERSSSPQGGIYADLILAVETLASSLPEGWELWIKEHPSQWWLRTKRYSSVRYRGYYERIARIPRVRIIPISTNSFELIERSSAVAVTTGTAGWESLLRGKCPLVFGIPWWRDCPGVLRVDSVETCRDAFQALQNGAHVTKQQILRYLKALEDTSIHAYIEPRIYGDVDYVPEDDMRIFANYIVKLLRDR